jgi:hypothetical protein
MNEEEKRKYRRDFKIMAFSYAGIFFTIMYLYLKQIFCG